ncbi:hypothetical protein [Streptomyces sp. gCLA4]|uniref:hypothetical protein n=1 Tax=Streptomyces sp. gCLA4 TaxID=1873416 RepID=UPI0016048012|nr:hypothetical protein [Streptomyces sp. gCLA4]
MAWRYRCGTCNTTWGWMSKTNASDLRDRHRDQRHGGGTPDGEEFISNAASATDDPQTLIVFGALLGLGALAWIWQQITGT